VTARIGEILVREGAVTVEDVERALDRQRDLAEASRRRVRVVIADDHLAIRDGLRAVLDDEDGFDVVGVAADGADALALIRERRPDVAILDNEMPRMTGLQVMETLRAESAPTAVVMFRFDSALRDAALRQGASAFLAKDAKPKELTDAVRRAARVEARETKVSVASALAASHAVWRAVSRRRAAAMTMGVLAVTYAGVFLIAEPFVGASASLVAIPVVAVAGAILGAELGALFALGSSALTAALWGVTGHERGEAVLTIGGNGLGVIALMGIGAGFGAMRLLGARLDRRGRRIDALLESGLLMTAHDPRLLEIAAEAARHTIRAEMLFLYAATGDGSLVVVAVSGAPASLVGHRETARGGTVQRALVQGRPRALRQDEAMTLHSRARSGVAVPAAPTGEEPEGVIIALSERPRGLDASDAATLARLAPSIWLALKIAKREPSSMRSGLVESAAASEPWGGRT
jgi:DNA-binding NarL/FixJ family response regulator